MCFPVPANGMISGGLSAEPLSWGLSVFKREKSKLPCLGDIALRGERVHVRELWKFQHLGHCVILAGGVFCLILMLKTPGDN